MQIPAALVVASRNHRGEPGTGARPAVCWSFLPASPPVNRRPRWSSPAADREKAGPAIGAVRDTRPAGPRLTLGSPATGNIGPPLGVGFMVIRHPL
jgi:hypothetical protein